MRVCIYVSDSGFAKEISSSWMIDLLGLSKQTSVGLLPALPWEILPPFAAARHRPAEK
jgi:hypothetical protein